MLEPARRPKARKAPAPPPARPWSPAEEGLRLGAHRHVAVGPVILVLGDALRVLEGIEGAAHMVATDPPYKLTSGGNGVQVMGGKFARRNYDNSGLLMPVVPWNRMAKPLFRAARADADAYVMANDKNVRDCLNAFDEAGWRFHNLLVWDKGFPTRNRWYMKDAEFTAYLWKGKARTINNPGSTQIQRFSRPRDAFHPTQKPVELVQSWIENSCDPGDLVLDPFAGSATSLVAAMRAGRRAIGIELNPAYFEAAVARLEAVWAQIQAGLPGDARP